MSGINTMEFMRFFVEQGHTFQIALMGNGDVVEEFIEVNKDNFEEYAKRIKEKT
ncbi:hypothetical protein [Methanobrevibacter sp. YE315]|uniref:hypothetical protein n=1 Tax=Methanobrevibacter sp. YE315 TaxID=1609968 RepID=UPI000AF9DC20|nr:hypothetical protein [Methanobrevibacter sp. YE315]